MTTISIRDLLHHFSGHLKTVKNGQKIVIMERNVPVAELSPYNANLDAPAWKRKIKKLKVRGVSASQTVARMRLEGDR